MDMDLHAAIYDLSVVINDDLSPNAEEIAENLGLDAEAAQRALSVSAPRYAVGEISQGAHWDDVAFKLGQEDTDLLAAFAERDAAVDQQILAKIRTQQATMTLGLVSDATPDWVGHWRRTLKLDQLFAVHIIGSELEHQRTYQGLMELAASRLQKPPQEIMFYSRKPAHNETASSLGMQLAT